MLDFYRQFARLLLSQLEQLRPMKASFLTISQNGLSSTVLKEKLLRPKTSLRDNEGAAIRMRSIRFLGLREDFERQILGRVLVLRMAVSEAVQSLKV